MTRSLPVSIAGWRVGRLGAFALAVLAFFGCQNVAPQWTNPPSSPSVTQTPSARIESDLPTATISPYLPASPSGSPSRVAGLRTNPLGELSGNWIFAANQVYEPQRELEIWAVPITGGTPKLAFAYELDTGTAAGLIDIAPYLRRQFAPDGRRMVVSIRGELVIVDLQTGEAAALGVAGRFPSWSRDGTQIAFLLPAPVPNAGTRIAIETVSVGGGAVRRLAAFTNAPQSVEWSADGSLIVVPQVDSIAVVDVADGRITRTLRGIPGPGPSFVHWRSRSPQLAVALFGCSAPVRLLGLERADAPVRALVESADTGERCLVILDPRWNPAADELLYLASPMNSRCCVAHVLDIASGYDASVPIDAQEATWSADGTQIVYIVKSHSETYGTDVRVWFRDGRGERSIILGKGDDRLVSIASVAY